MYDRETGLNEKQTLFCKYYIETLNGYKSAVKAGYSEKTARQKAHNMLQQPNIKDYINKQLQLAHGELGITKGEIINGIKSLAFDDKVPANVRLNALCKLGDSLQLFTKEPQVVINNNPQFNTKELSDEEIEDKLRELEEIEGDTNDE